MCGIRLFGVYQLTLLHLCCRRKTSAKSFNPDVTTDEEDVKKPDVTPQKFEMQKTSLQVSYVQREQDKDVDNESIEMVPLPVGGGYSYTPLYLCISSCCT